MTKQHETSITFKAAIARGAHVSQQWDNGQEGDHAASIIEFDRSIGCYIFDNTGIGFTTMDFDDAVRAYQDGSIRFDEWDGTIHAALATYEDHIKSTATAAQAHRQADEHRARSFGAPSIFRDAANKREQAAHVTYMAAVLDAEDFCDANGIERNQFDRDVEFRIGY